MKPIPSGDRWPEGTFLGMLSPTCRSALLELGTTKDFPRLQPILPEAQVSDHVVVLVSGVVKMTKSLENGRFALLGIKVGGDVVGEMAALSGQPRSATVTACSKIRARVVAAAEFRRYLEAHPKAHLALDQMIMQTLRFADKRRVDFMGYSTLVRLARVLDELAESYGRPVPSGVRIDLGLTQRELGALVGAEKDAAGRELRGLRDHGVIEMGYRTITIVDRPSLSRIADDAKPGNVTI